MENTASNINVICGTMKTSNIYVSGVQKGEERENEAESILLDKIFLYVTEESSSTG